jgi:hypothetical protein
MDNFLVSLKKDLYIAIVSNGSMVQKENAIATAQKAYEWCIASQGQAETTSDSELQRIKVDAPRRGRPKNTDK